MRASDVTIEWLQEHLEGWEGSNGQYYAWCCVHDDVGTSVKGLSITVRPNGKILVKCHSPQCGATLTDIIKAVEGGYDYDEEIPDVQITKTPSTKGKAGLKWWAQYTHVETHVWEMLGCFDYSNEEDGPRVKFVFAESDVIKIRKPPKDYKFEPKGAECSPLWPIPQDELPDHVSITEGESDCGTTYAAGLPPGFSVTKGADTPLSVETFLALAQRGVREITLYADADSAGKEFRAKVIRLAIDARLGVNVCDLTLVVDPFYPHKDINSLWKTAESEEEFHEQVERATYRVQEQKVMMDVQAQQERSKMTRTWIIDRFLSPGDKVMIWGPPKVYKTWIVLDLVRSLTTCTPFLKRTEWTPSQPARVLLVEEEGNIDGLLERTGRLNLNIEDPFFLIHKQGIAFNDSDTISYLISICREYEIDVLIMDPLQRMIPGINENDSAEVGVVWDEITRMQKLCEGLCVVVVHHSNKSDASGWMTSRGASRHGGEVDLGIEVRKHPIEENTVSIWMDGRDVNAQLAPDSSFKGEITITETEFEIDASDVEVKVNKVRMKGDQNERAVLEAIREGYETRTQIKNELNLSDPTVLKHLEALEEKGEVEWTKDGNVYHYKVRQGSA